jgi:hypothetical protein
MRDSDKYQIALPQVEAGQDCTKWQHYADDV